MVPDRWLTPHRNRGSAAQEYSSAIEPHQHICEGGISDPSSLIITYSFYLINNHRPAVYDTAALPLSHASICVRAGLAPFFISELINNRCPGVSE